ncbi:MAG TPA: hypothetical protein VMJ75_28145 [Candidatus Acidoferrales bacterium]|nr:hypothetical protein [Candidatus Acidoferrales bacterium]
MSQSATISLVGANPAPSIAVTALQCGAASLSSNGSTTCTITLNQPASGSGTPVTVGSSAAALTVPGSVNVPSGSSSATFSAVAGAITADQTATLTASLSGTSASVSISLVSSNTITSLQCGITSLLSNASGTCTVTLNKAAVAGGVTVAVADSVPWQLTVPASVNVAAGASTATFPVSTGAITSDQSVTITASLNGSSASANIQVVAPIAVTGLQCTASSLASNASTTCTVTLNKAATTGGVTVSLGNSVPTLLTVPASLSITQGSTSATFTATAGSITSAQTASLTASLNGTTASTSISLVAAAGVTVSSLQCTASSLSSNSATFCKITLTQAAPAGGATVTIADSAPTLLVAPTTWNVSAGSTTATFSVGTQNITTSQTATLTASLNGSSQSATISLVASPTATTVTALQCGAASLLSNGSTTCTITLSQAASDAGAAVTLGSSATVLTVPGSVNVPSGSSTATFSAAAGTIAADQTATLTASLSGSSASATISLVAPNSVTSLGCGSSSLGSNASATCTVTLNKAAISGGVSVTLANSASSALTVPGSVSIAAGATTATFTASTGSITTDRTATLTASLNGSSASATISLVSANTVTSLQCGISSLLSNASGTCTVTLNKAAAAGGVTVTIADTVPAQLTVPASVNVVAGASTANFPVSTGAVTSDQSVTVTASLNGSSASANIQMVAPNTVTGLQCSGSSLASNASTTCTVTLNKAAITGGVTVSLGNSAPTLLTIPGSLSITQGSTSGTFTASAGSITSAQTASLTASVNGTTASTTISLLAAAGVTVSSLHCYSTSLSSNSATFCQVSLSQAAPAGGVTVTIADSAPTLLVAPTSWNVSAGSTTATFSVGTQNVPTNQTVTLTASLNGSSQSVTLSLVGTSSTMSVSSLQCGASSLSANASTTCTVTLSQAAPAGGATVTLDNNMTTVLTAPSSVSVPAGTTSAQFAASTGIVATSQVATLTATMGSSTSAATISLVPPAPGPSLVFFACHLTSTTAPISGTCNLNLSANVSSATQVSLSSSSSSIVVPDSVAVTAGSQSAFFEFTGTTADVTSIVVTATLGNSSLAATWAISFGGGTGGALNSISCVPKHVTAGQSTTCQVETGKPSATATELKIASSSANVLVPAVLKPGAGTRTTRFKVTATQTAGLGSAVITATLGSDSVSDSLAVLPSDAPTLAAPREVTVKAGSPARFSVQAYDADGSPLSVSAAGLPDSATFDNTTGAFGWLSTTQDIGSREISFTAVRPAGDPLNKAVKLSVSDGTPILRSVRNGAGEGAPAACSSGAAASLFGHFLADSADSAADPSASGTGIGGTRVLVNGEYAALLSVSATRVDFLCPAAPASAQLEIRVETSSGVSNALQTTMNDTAPGIYSVDGSGRGQALAVLAASGNLAAVSDYRFTGNPVMPGDTIAVRATGIGCSSTTPLPQLQIGADSAKVVSVATTETAGVCVVNAVVPAGLSGDEVPLTLQIARPDGSMVRSNTVTIAVDLRN